MCVCVQRLTVYKWEATTLSVLKAISRFVQAKSTKRSAALWWHMVETLHPPETWNDPCFIFASGLTAMPWVTDSANFSCWVTGSTVRQEHAKDSSWNRPLSCLTTKQGDYMEIMDRPIHHRLKICKFQICFLANDSPVPDILSHGFFFLPVQISSTCKISNQKEKR